MNCIAGQQPEHAHVQPLQIGPRQEGVDQHSRYVVEHELGEIDTRGIRETALVDTLEGKISTRSNDGTATTQGGCVGSSYKVTDCRLGRLQWPVENQTVSTGRVSNFQRTHTHQIASHFQAFLPLH